MRASLVTAREERDAARAKLAVAMVGATERSSASALGSLRGQLFEAEEAKAHEERRTAAAGREKDSADRRAQSGLAAASGAEAALASFRAQLSAEGEARGLRDELASCKQVHPLGQN
jgi:hypothetical protein